MMQEIEAELARPQADLFLLELIDHIVMACVARAPGLTEGDLRAGHVLQFERHMLPDMAHPRALVFLEASDETTGYAIRAAVIVQAWQGFQQGVDKGRTQSPRGPVLQDTEVDLMANDRKERVDVWSAKDRGFCDLHLTSPSCPGQ